MSSLAGNAPKMPVYLSGVFIIGIALGLFVFLAIQVRRDGFVPELDENWAMGLKAHAAEHRVWRVFFRGITEVGGVLAMVLLGTAGTLVSAWRGRYRLAVVWALAAGGGALLNLGVKEWIDRDRPGREHRDRWLSEDNESFPSGHAMGATIGYGMLAYALGRRRAPRGRLFLAGGFVGLILLIGFSRLYLRAHWFSDVVGGFALGAAWLTTCLLLLRWWTSSASPSVHPAPSH
jgi:membrane-associated phospholipid phosphatase